jgi:MFS family permease
MEAHTSSKSLWTNRNYLMLFGSYTISSLGDWLDMIGIMILFTYVWQAPSSYVALIPVAFALPSVVFSQFAGVVADRGRKRQILIATDVLRVVLTALILLAPGPLTVLALLVLRGMAGVFQYPAFQALNRHVIEEHQLFEAINRGMLVRTIAKIAGPLLGGVIASAFSPGICLQANALTFLLSAVLLLRMRGVKEEAPAAGERPERERFGTAWRAGWTAILHSRLLLGSVGFFLIGYATIHFAESQLNILLREVAPDQPALAGYTVSLFGAGTILVSMLLKKIPELQPYYGWVIGGGLALIGVSFGWFGLFPSGVALPMVLLASVIGGVGVGGVLLGFNYLVQKETPSARIGRVLGIIQSLTSLVMLVFPLTGSLFVEQYGVKPTLQTVGILLVLIGTGGILLQKAIFRPAAGSNEQESEAASA